jgi:hypothetical protein
MHLFVPDADFEAFQRVLIEVHRRHPIRILSYCIVSNYWHFVVWPQTDGAVTGLHHRAQSLAVSPRNDPIRFASFPSAPGSGSCQAKA